MNSYFEQSGFYGSHHHQSAGVGVGVGGGASHHDQTAAAYRSFPLSLGMSPYAAAANHHHGLHQSARPPQDSPYDASVAAACKLYSTGGSESSQQTGGYGKPDCSKAGGGGGDSHQNGYAAVVAAAKDAWQAQAQQQQGVVSGPVRPAACTPDSRVGYGGPVPSLDAASSSPGPARASSWNSTCSLGAAAPQPAATQLHQQPNHTFYPWMAIAGQ